MVTVFIGIGANIGNREETMRTAIKLLAGSRGVIVEKVSSFVETEPIGGPPQPLYINAVAKIQTNLLPQELLVLLQGIEQRLGRKRIVRMGPRTIDLDILSYGQMRVNTQTLQIPHPRIFERPFILTALREVDPTFDIEWIHGLIKDNSND